MTISRKAFRNFQTSFQIITGFVLAGYIYLTVILAVGEAFNQPIYPFTWFSYFRVTIIGILVGCSVSIAEVVVFPRIIYRFNFVISLILRSLLYLVFAAIAVLLFTIIYHTIYLGISPIDVFESEMVQVFLKGEFLVILLLCLIVAFIINTARLTVNRFGETVFWDYITGRYHFPREEERVFMFLDLDDSTAIAERLGHHKYHHLLNDLFKDISEAIWHNMGEIYQYVGDEVVITWTLDHGLKHANAVQCFFEIQEAILQREKCYRKRYGFVPHFKAGLHAGKVIAGEVGELKTEIVFHGDTVNTASRIRSACAIFHRDILVSADLLKGIKTSIIGHYMTEFIGHIKLKGKEQEIGLYSIAEVKQLSDVV